MQVKLFRTPFSERDESLSTDKQAMTRSTQTRRKYMTGISVRGVASLLLGSLATSAYAGLGHHGFQQSSHPAPVVRSAPPPPPVRPQPPASQAQRGNAFVPHSGENQMHLQQWMQSHSNLPLDAQQRALAAEPGFAQLPPQVQLRMHQQLAQLNGMTPAQRQRTLDRTEAMEALQPEQRLQVRNALVGLGALPEDRRRFVGRTFRALRDLPDPQRQAYLNSPAMRSQFTEQERAVLNNLFVVAPYLPPPPAPAPPPPR